MNSGIPGQGEVFWSWALGLKKKEKSSKNSKGNLKHVWQNTLLSSFMYDMALVDQCTHNGKLFLCMLLLDVTLIN